MKRKHAMACCVGMVLWLGMPAAFSAEKSRGASWSDVAKWPDFMGGVWGSGLGAGGPDEARGLPKPKYKPGVYEAAMADPSRALYKAGSASCDPHGIPVDVGGEFFFSRGTIFLMADVDYFITRRIDMTRTEHDDPDPTYYGDSIGHWEGTTLVVDTVGFLPQVALAEGVPGKGATHVVERFRLVGTDKMELTITVTNPELLQEPWVTTRTMTRHRDWTVHEAYCTQNNRMAPVNGKANIDLTPPK
ncbi:MAG: hypothetical protein QM808_16830 [Steroidobacteraceae bacterium]